ncbi:MAG TPA: helix-turn-helix domain-containing protein [Trebonia sp.]
MVATRAYRSAVREAQARRTRERVLEAATAIVLDRGYAGMTVRAVAAGAGVSVPTVEALFGTKSRLLKAAIDVAIAGDDEPVAVLDRPWARLAGEARSLEELLPMVAGVLAAAQQRSAGLVLAVFEGSSHDAELRALREQMAAQRQATAAWIVRRMTGVARLRSGCDVAEAVDVVWLLMDPAVFVRLTRERRWSVERYRRWIADALARLLVTDLPTKGGKDAEGRNDEQEPVDA